MMSKEKGKKLIKIVILFSLVGIIFGLRVFQWEQNKEIEELKQELSETQEQLLISNDQLRQIYMYNEREYYMESEEE